MSRREITAWDETAAFDRRRSQMYRESSAIDRHFTKTRRVALLGFCISFSAACNDKDQQTGILLALSFTGIVDRVDVSLSSPTDGSTKTAHSDANATLSSPQRMLLIVPETWSGQQLAINASALRKGQHVAEGKTDVAIERGQIVSAGLSLSERCSDGCRLGESQCVGDAVRVCQEDASGCAHWQPPKTCSAPTPYCTAGRCAADCQDECQPAQRRCDGDGAYQVCGAFDSDSCQDYSPSISCESGSQCRASDGVCIKLCDGKPCSCNPGDVTSCADLGICRGGQRRCQAGVFGDCSWTVGPQAEVCNGDDDDCDGTIDEIADLVAPACTEQRGVCKGATQTCGGKSGWQSCAPPDYAAHAQRSGATFQTDETLCDGQDNDCDGAVDEPAACCKPQCAAASCGAKDGCGGTCLSGDCPLNQNCNQGACVCMYAQCNGNCCAQGEICRGNTCGPRCKATAPVTVAESGDDVLDLELDVQGNAQIAFHHGDSETVRLASNASGSWTSETVDSEGWGPALALDSLGRPHLAYYQLRNTPNNEPALFYATKTANGWSTTALGKGMDADVAVDAQDKVHLVYFEPKARFVYATNASGSWVKQTIMSTTQSFAGDHSIAIDKTGKVHVSFFISYQNIATSSDDLGYATNANASGSWTVQTVDATDRSGRRNSLALDANGKAHIVYIQNSARILKHASNASGSWVITPIDTSGDLWATNAMVLDSQGAAHVTYYALTGPMRYATNASGSWTVKQDPNIKVNKHTALAITPFDQLYLAYQAPSGYIEHLSYCP
ncbi:MAG: hypothetical protein H6707_20430 [Deltaproteobacteria bacterium]|nr:hypothetical protein [Deltaproteobacteria bacterium]